MVSHSSSEVSMTHTLYFAVGPDDDCHGPFITPDAAKYHLAELHKNDEISSIEGYSIFEGKEILVAERCLDWVKQRD
jgi:hypothetical protein